jgi:hypothetical protein
MFYIKRVRNVWNRKYVMSLQQYIKWRLEAVSVKYTTNL